VGLGGADLVHQCECSEEPFSCLLGGFGVRGEHLLGRLADGPAPRGYPHCRGRRDGIGGVDLVVGVVQVHRDLEKRREKLAAARRLRRPTWNRWLTALGMPRHEELARTLLLR
jgi:hypothetical protein